MSPSTKVPLSRDNAACLPLNAIQSAVARYPLSDAPATCIEIDGVVPPLETTGAVPATEATPPPLPTQLRTPVLALTVQLEPSGFTPPRVPGCAIGRVYEPPPPPPLPGGPVGP